MGDILDSGNRRKFTSGAVRDIQEGKGRTDLMPLDTISEVCNQYEKLNKLTCPFNRSNMFFFINSFIENNSKEDLFILINSFIDHAFDNISTALIELSIHYEQGALKYGERNWEKGIPAHCYIDSGIRHGLKYLRGDNDERHDRAFLWNLVGLIWTLDHHPELDDLVKLTEESEEGC